MKKHALFALVLSLAYFTAAASSFADEPKVAQPKWKIPAANDKQGQLDSLVQVLTETNNDPVLEHIRRGILSFDNPTKLVFSLNKSMKDKNSTGVALDSVISNVLALLKDLTPEQYNLVRDKVVKLQKRTRNDGQPTFSAIGAKNVETFFEENHDISKREAAKPEDIAKFLGPINALDDLLDARRSCGPLSEMAARAESIKQSIAKNATDDEAIVKSLKEIADRVAKITVSPELKQDIDKMLATFRVPTEGRDPFSIYFDSLRLGQVARKDALEGVTAVLKSELALTAADGKELPESVYVPLAEKLIASEKFSGEVKLDDRRTLVLANGRHMDADGHHPIDGPYGYIKEGDKILGQIEPEAAHEIYNETHKLSYLKEIPSVIRVAAVYGADHQAASDLVGKRRELAEAKKKLEQQLAQVTTCHDSVAAIDQQLLKVDPREVSKPENAEQVVETATAAAAELRKIAESAK
ncbi:MAG: hypothetical protein AB7P04_03900 [Bacteriovoracia bacterium]